MLAPVGVALCQMGGALGAMDRHQKQADYTRLSHPANTRTVMAKTMVDQPKPLHPNSLGCGTGGVHSVLARQQYRIEEASMEVQGATTEAVTAQCSSTILLFIVLLYK